MQGKCKGNWWRGNQETGDETRREEMKLDEMRWRVFSFLEKTVRAPQQMGWDEDAFEKEGKKGKRKEMANRMSLRFGCELAGFTSWSWVKKQKQKHQAKRLNELLQYPYSTVPSGRSVCSTSD